MWKLLRDKKGFILSVSQHLAEIKAFYKCLWDSCLIKGRRCSILVPAACLTICLFFCPSAEGALCPDPPSGKPAMATKRKGGLKLNAICAKLSRQVVVEQGADPGVRPEGGQGNPLRPREKEQGGGSEAKVTQTPRSEEDRRRAVIEKWVNGSSGTARPSRCPAAGPGAHQWGKGPGWGPLDPT
ncbi:zinc finger protein castor homolog 1-like [Sarcophilus harrisii]|uniref:zinc finger protein castor homolog 1-like n=1 Tax=Sarcophilus harrisii TaxID=9305 RepID=UPI001301CF0D|nr:zinc finger protein castor homolog 1-like [Sarcophilus harrisii]